MCLMLFQCYVHISKAQSYVFSEKYIIHVYIYVFLYQCVYIVRFRLNDSCQKMVNAFLLHMYITYNSNQNHGLTLTVKHLTETHSQTMFRSSHCSNLVSYTYNNFFLKFMHWMRETLGENVGAYVQLYIVFATLSICLMAPHQAS